MSDNRKRKNYLKETEKPIKYPVIFLNKLIQLKDQECTIQNFHFKIL